MSLNGRRVVVTGATSGVGRHLAETLHAAGASLILLGRSAARLAELAALQPAPEVQRVDFEVDDEVEQVGDRLAGGTVDVLIHNAGIIEQASVAEARIADLDRQYRVNVRAPYRLTQLLLPSLKASRGTVVFMNSSVGVAAAAGVSQYAATKHALKGIADSLRAEVNASGVRVVSIYLGRTATPLQARLHERMDKPYRPEAMIQLDAVSRLVLDTLQVHDSAEITDLHIRPMQKS